MAVLSDDAHVKVNQRDVNAQRIIPDLLRILNLRLLFDRLFFLWLLLGDGDRADISLWSTGFGRGLLIRLFLLILLSLLILLGLLSLALRLTGRSASLAGLGSQARGWYQQKTAGDQGKHCQS